MPEGRPEDDEQDLQRLAELAVAVTVGAPEPAGVDPRRARRVRTVIAAIRAAR